MEAKAGGFISDQSISLGQGQVIREFDMYEIMSKKSRTKNFKG